MRVKPCTTELPFAICAPDSALGPGRLYVNVRVPGRWRQPSVLVPLQGYAFRLPRPAQADRVLRTNLRTTRSVSASERLRADATVIGC
jgi:hypothetical protein